MLFSILVLFVIVDFVLHVCRLRRLVSTIIQREDHITQRFVTNKVTIISQ